MPAFSIMYFARSKNLPFLTQILIRFCCCLAKRLKREKTPLSVFVLKSISLRSCRVGVKLWPLDLGALGTVPRRLDSMQWLLKKVITACAKPLNHGILPWQLKLKTVTKQFSSNSDYLQQFMNFSSFLSFSLLDIYSFFFSFTHLFICSRAIHDFHSLKVIDWWSKARVSEFLTRECFLSVLIRYLWSIVFVYLYSRINLDVILRIKGILKRYMSIHTLNSNTPVGHWKRDFF